MFCDFSRSSWHDSLVDSFSLMSIFRIQLLCLASRGRPCRLLPVICYDRQGCSMVPTRPLWHMPLKRVPLQVFAQAVPFAWNGPLPVSTSGNFIRPQAHLSDADSPMPSCSPGRSNIVQPFSCSFQCVSLERHHHTITYNFVLWLFGYFSYILAAPEFLMGKYGVTWHSIPSPTPPAPRAGGRYLPRADPGGNACRSHWAFLLLLPGTAITI